MAANTAPIYSRLGSVQWAAKLTSAAADTDGTGANNALVFTADATNGGMGVRIRCKAAGTNVASVLRVFINNGSTNGTATNNWYYDDIALPATTLSAVGQTGPTLDFALGFPFEAGQRVYVGLGTAVAAGWHVGTIGGKY